MIRFFETLLFGKKPAPKELIQATMAVKTAPLSEEQLESVSRPESHFNPPQMVVGTSQSVGLQRDHNEDTLFAMQAMLADGTNDIPFGIFVMADGMGGHQNGEIASSAAARTFGEFLLARFYIPFLSAESGSGESIHEIMENAVREAQREVLRNAPGGGTTLTAAMVLGEQVTVAHVGDSRLYFAYPDGRMSAMTQDHSLVRRLQDLGQINEQEAAVHPQRSVLYRALGQPEPFRPDINTHTLPRPGYMLLCSDGLWGSVSEDELYRILKNSTSPSAACHQMVASANAAGGPDNISVILIQFLS